MRGAYGYHTTSKYTYSPWKFGTVVRVGTQYLASQARLFRAVAELTARESHEEEALLPKLLQREKSLVAFENVIVTCDPDPVS